MSFLKRYWREKNSYGVQQSQKVVRVFEESTPLAAAPSSKTGSLVLFSAIWSVTDSRSKLSPSRPSRHGFLPAVLSLIYCQALTDTFSDLLSSLILTLRVLKIAGYLGEHL